MSLAAVDKIDDSEDFYQVLIEELQRRDGLIQVNNIRGIICPKCGEPEAFSFVNNPSIIYVNKKGEEGKMAQKMK